MIFTTTTRKYEARIQQHAFVAQQKARFLMAFAATILFLCIENVKAFTAPLSNPNTLIFMASGAHSVAKSWKAKPTTFGIRQTPKSQTTEEIREEQGGRGDQSQMLGRSQRISLTSLNMMTFGFGDSSTTDSPPTLDMKTSLNAFGSWYNKMDPVARPPDYDDEETDYSLSSPADSWPSSFEEETTTSATMIYSTNPRSSSSQSSFSKRRPHPIRTIRKIAGWVLRSSPARNARGFGSQNFF
jgi:hypothetical protein